VKEVLVLKAQAKGIYPLTASLYRTAGFEVLRPEDLYNLFSVWEYNLVAVGIESNKQCAYICLRSLEDLNEFVRQTDGSTLNDGDIWMAETRYDPIVVPVSTAAEYFARKRLENEAEAQGKREQRRLKKVSPDFKDLELSLEL
jgi:hypothetical protein